LNAGYRIPAIGGSDNHDAQLPPDRPGSIGSPTTVVYAKDLSVTSILAGMRSGRVFVDLTGSKDRLLDLTAHGSGAEAVMGGTTQARSGEVLELSAHVIACSGSKVRIVVDGREDSSMPQAAITSADQTLTAKWTSDGRRHWLRADVVSDSGKLEILGNPIYVNFP
jgi:hypothetical protein